MKRLVLCCDGTWNRADQAVNGVPCPTNVVKTAYRVAKRDASGVSQIVFYDQGVGTGNTLDRYTGGAFGAGLEDNIHDAYRFLVANYEEGDEIYLFGFSRGAYTARSLAGMIRNCGILARSSIEHYREALHLYEDHGRGPDHPDAREFKAKHSVCSVGDVKIKFIGVWDTVGALGIPLRGLRFLTRRRHQFHDTELSGTVEHAYHALAVDERRGAFQPATWAYVPKPGQTVEQVWFCGVHSDVGGGYPETGLSDVALSWLMEKASGAGLTFDEDVVRTYPLGENCLQALHESRSGLYRLAPGVDRVIGMSRKRPEAPLEADPTQSVHPTVRQRWDEDPRYRPAALKAYFARMGDPRG